MARVALQDYCDEARDLINSRAYEEAIAICQHILKRYPKHMKTYQILGEACLEKGELEEAISIFKRLLDRADPENFVAYAGLGVAYEEKGQIAEAVWYMERAFELASSNEEIRNALRRLYGKRDSAEPARIKLNKVALARLYAKGGQYRQAIEEFRHLLELEPNRDRLDIKVSLAETLWRDGRREQAAEMARQVLQTTPDCLKAILLLGMIQIEKGRESEGRAILAKARNLDPENKMAQALFGAHSPLPPQVVKIPRIEEKPEAKAAPTEVPTPVTPTVEEEVAPVAAPEKEVIPEEKKEAEAVPTEVSELVAPAAEEGAVPVAAPVKEVSPEETTLASAAATTTAPLSDVERYKLHLEQKPKDDETRLALARAYRDQEQIKLALEQYTALVRAKPNILAQVVSDMESIVASRPDNLEAHELLADFYAQNGQLQKAVDRYRWILQRLEQRPA